MMYMDGMDDMMAQFEGAPELDENGVARAGAALPEGHGAVAEIANVVEAMSTVYDPEIPVNIFELGLIYKYNIDAKGDVDIDMTLTAPGCPVAGVLPGHLAKTVAEIEGVGRVSVQLAWEPPWDVSMMSEAARLELNMF